MCTCRTAAVTVREPRAHVEGGDVGGGRGEGSGGAGPGQPGRYPAPSGQFLSPLTNRRLEAPCEAPAAGSGALSSRLVI